ncbi:unnamed protein product, partial [Discosporangium mesarthrocarpum]
PRPSSGSGGESEAKSTPVSGSGSGSSRPLSGSWSGSGSGSGQGSVQVSGSWSASGSGSGSGSGPESARGLGPSPSSGPGREVRARVQSSVVSEAKLAGGQVDLERGGEGGGLALSSMSSKPVSGEGGGDDGSSSAVQTEIGATSSEGTQATSTSTRTRWPPWTQLFRWGSPASTERASVRPPTSILAPPQDGVGAMGMPSAPGNASESGYPSSTSSSLAGAAILSAGSREGVGG